MKEKKIFWLDGDYKAKGGYFFRAFDIARFIEKLEETIGEVVGITIDVDTDNENRYENNIEFIIKDKQ